MCPLCFQHTHQLLSLVTGTIEKAVRTTVVVGMKPETWIARRPGIRVVSVVNAAVLAGLCPGAKKAQDRCGLISFGVAGGLASNLPPGTWIVRSEILRGESRFATYKLRSKSRLARMSDAAYGTIARALLRQLAEPGAKARCTLKRAPLW